MRGAGSSKNRHSDFFPANVHPVSVPPPLPRSNSVPIATLQTIARNKAAGTQQAQESNGNDTDVTAHPEDDDAEQRTLNQREITRQLSKEAKSIAIAATLDADSTQKNDIPKQETPEVAQRTIDEEEEGPTGLEAFQREEAITVVHSPVSAEQWRADLQKAGQQIGQKSKGKKVEGNPEEEAQLVCVHHATEERKRLLNVFNTYFLTRFCNYGT
jgi:striatin 1/3/4